MQSMRLKRSRRRCPCPQGGQLLLGIQRSKNMASLWSTAQKGRACHLFTEAKPVEKETGMPKGTDGSTGDTDSGAKKTTTDVGEEKA